MLFIEASRQLAGEYDSIAIFSVENTISLEMTEELMIRASVPIFPMRTTKLGASIVILVRTIIGITSEGII